jgi:hypothetical protein
LHEAPLIRRLLLRSRFGLDHAARWAVDRWLADHPELRELYEAKEAHQVAPPDPAVEPISA